MLSLRFTLAFGLLALTACPAPEPARAPTPEAPATEADAREALDRAKKKGDPEELIALFNKYPKFQAGKTALRLGVRKLLEHALDAAEACNEGQSSKDLAKVAPYTSDDPEIDEAYDETKNAVLREHKRCKLVVLDADVQKAESAGDYAKAFARITGEKDADGAALNKRRVELTIRWKKWLDDTLKAIVAKKSLAAALGDKREQFDDATDPEQLPPEVASELAKRQATLAAILLVFEKLQGGQLIDPPVRYWTYGAAKARRIDTPSASDGAVMANGVPFTAVAKGKLGGVQLLVVGNAEGDALARLSSIKLLIPEADARTYDTRVALPEQLVGVKVFAPIAPGSEQLAPAIVLSEDGKGAIVVQPLAKKGQKLTYKRKDLRGLSMNPGMKVTVMIGNAAKPGELADAPEEDRVLVKVGGFENYFPVADIRVKRTDLPNPPAE